MRRRSELFANTIATWTWSQGTLLVSILTLPLLTRLLSKDEFGLWSQLLSLSGLSTVADMGMSLVFLRRLTDPAIADQTSILRSATAFYNVSSAALTAVLLLVSLIPGGVLSPYLSHTRLSALAAVVVIAAIGVNLRCQTATLRLLAQGRMDLERIFGAGPAVAGTLLTVLAAYWFATAVAVAIAYAVVEIAFNVGLVFVAYRRWPRSRIKPVADRTLAWWGRLWYESTGVLAIDLVPLVSLTIGIAVVGHVLGPAAAAVYGLAGKVASLVRRFFTPFTDSLFVSLCRTAAQTRAAVSRLAVWLCMITLAGGTATAFVVVAIGAYGMRIMFGDGYGYGIGAVLVLVLTETIRSMYRPPYRKIQSDDRIGPLRYWFAISMIIQVPAMIIATEYWGLVGAALAVLACSAVFEAAPVARRLIDQRSEGAGGKHVLKVTGSVICAGFFVVLLAWVRQRMGIVAIGFAVIGAATAGLFTTRQIVRYLTVIRTVTESPLPPDRVPWRHSRRRHDRAVSDSASTLPAIAVQQPERHVEWRIHADADAAKYDTRPSVDGPVA